MKKLIVICFAILSGQVLAASESSLLPNESSVLGKVNGNDIILKEIQSKKIHDLRRELYKELENAFITEAINRLKKTNKEFARITVPPSKEQDIRKFYDENGLAMRGSYEMFAPQIRLHLAQTNRAREEYKLYKMAGEKGQVSSRLVDPGPFIVTLPVETAFIQGAKNGSVMLLEFSDFQCPYCKKVQPALQKLVKIYKDKVAFGYRHFPLAFHQEADESAIASECAREQGKFIEMHTRLYEQQEKQSVEELKGIAKDIGVKDLQKFNTCLTEDKYRKLLNRDMEVAQSVGINGTPAFVIGNYDSKSGIIKGEILSGALPVEVIEQVLLTYLGK
jgi:protein-disulfide isomerase